MTAARDDEPRDYSRRKGHRYEARAMLADVHNWFIEDLDTLGLKAAKALLDKLGKLVIRLRPAEASH